MSDALALVIQRAIRAERARLGISQAELAERLGWSRSRVAALETGARRVYAHELPELCEALEIEFSELLGRASADDRRRLGLPRTR